MIGGLSYNDGPCNSNFLSVSIQWRWFWLVHAISVFYYVRLRGFYDTKVCFLCMCTLCYLDSIALRRAWVSGQSLPVVKGFFNPLSPVLKAGAPLVPQSCQLTLLRYCPTFYYITYIIFSAIIFVWMLLYISCCIYFSIF